LISSIKEIIGGSKEAVRIKLPYRNVGGNNRLSDFRRGDQALWRRSNQMA
jgi:hypothetical protein